MSTSNNQINFLGILYWLVSSIKKRIKILIVINILLGVLVTSAKLYIPESYEGSLIVKSNIIEYHFIEQILSPLGRHLKDKRKESIAKSLKIPQQLANNFGGYEINSLIDEEYVTKRRNTIADNLSEYEKDQIFELKVRAGNKADLPKLKNALLRYLRNQDYIKKREEFFTQRQKDAKEMYEADIESMAKIKESFAKSGFDPSTKDNDLIIQGLGDFFFGSMRIYSNYMDTRYLIEFNDSFEELSNFEIYDKHVAPRWTPFIVLYIILALVISFIYITVAELGIALKNYKSEE